MIIISTHVNTDLDALASMVAAKKLYPEAEMVFPGKLFKNVEEFMSLHKDIFAIKSVKDINLNSIQKIILVDTKTLKRINKLAVLLEKPGMDVHIYDHHPWADGDIHGSVEIVEMVGATVTLLVEKIKSGGIDITPPEATIMALGIYADTGSLMFTSTTSRDAEAVSFLITKGAKLAVVSEFLGRPMNEEQKLLLKALLMSAERHIVNGIKVIIATAESKEFVEGLSLLTHTLAEIERTDAVFCIVLMENRVTLVGRSNIPQVNIAEILSPFMGGGHPAAASATVKNGNVTKLAESLKEIILAKVKPPLSVTNIMSCPVKTVFEHTLIEEVSNVMMRYGHSGLPVVEGTTLKGIISRRDVEKAIKHGLGHAPVKGFMTSKVISAKPEISVYEIRELMITNDIGRIPVVKDGRLLGIVSRTDVLKTLHGNYQTRYQMIREQQLSQFHFDDNISKAMKKKLSPSILKILKQAGKIGEQMGFQVFTAGGVVRDLLLDHITITDLDIVVEGNGIALAEAIAEKTGAQVRSFHQFGTSELTFTGNFKVDIATARVEYYEYPAALPQVESSSLKQDLYRRDFTINAMAVSLNSNSFGDLSDFFGGREDLHNGLVRVLYNLSFIEDPTRIMRAVRFEQRYFMNIEPHTLKLLKNAIRQRVLLKVSNDRLWAEIEYIFTEPEADKMLSRLNNLHIWPQIFPGIKYLETEIPHLIKGINNSIMMMVNWGLFKQTDSSLSSIISILHRSDKKSAESICLKYNFNKKQTAKVLTALDGWKEIVDGIKNTTGDNRISFLAQKILDLPVDAYPLLITLLDNDHLKQRFKDILVAIKKTKPILNGKFIKSLGYKPGPIFREALTELWKARLDGLVQNETEEKDFLTNYMKAKGRN